MDRPNASLESYYSVPVAVAHQVLKGFMSQFQDGTESGLQEVVQTHTRVSSRGWVEY